MYPFTPEDILGHTMELFAEAYAVPLDVAAEYFSETGLDQYVKGCYTYLAHEMAEGHLRVIDGFIERNNLSLPEGAKRVKYLS